MADPTLPAKPTADRLDATTGGDVATFEPAPAAPLRADRYALGDEIAHGGMGVVYHATDTVFDREVAVKVLQERYAAAPAAARRFATEARIAGQLQHPGIPPVHDLGTLADGRPFLAMKYIKGDTLDDRLKQRRDAADDRGYFVGVFEQVCQAVAYAHSNGVIHRDLKPANVMVGKFGEVQVMDWGLAKVLGADAGPDTDPDTTSGGTVIRTEPASDADKTQAGSAVGTPAYMPPEQAIGALGQVDRRSDVFGLGGVLAVILTGRQPYAAATGEETRVLAARGKIDDCFARLDASGADPGYVALCKRCLAPEREHRPADAREVADAVAGLRAAAEDRARAAEVERERAEVRTAEGRKRRRVVAAAAGLLIVALAAGVVGTTVGMMKAEANEAAAKAAQGEAVKNETAAKKAQKEAEESYELAREAVVGVAWDVPDVLRQALFAQNAEKKIATLLADTMEKQLALASTRHLPDRALHRIHVRLGDLLAAQARFDDAQKHYDAALAVSARVLATETRAKDRAKVDHATSHSKLGTLGMTRGFGGDPDRVFDHFLKAEALCREVVTAPTTGEVEAGEAKFLLATAVYETARARERRQEYGLAAAACEEAQALLTEVLKEEPTRATAGAGPRLADVRILLGEAEFKRGRNAEAEAAMRAASRSYDVEVDRDPNDLDLKRRGAIANRAAGDLLLFLHRYEDARHFHARDVQLSRGLLRTPEIVAAEAELSYAHYRSGTLALRRGDPAAAQFYYRRCVTLREEMVAAQPNNEQSRLALARALARYGDHLGAVAAFEPVRVRHAGTLSVASQQAVVYGLCADALRAGRPVADLPWYDRKAYDQYLDEAFAGLDRAVTDWDWLDIVGLKTDPDFDPLRADPRFADAVRKVEARIAGRKF